MKNTYIPRDISWLSFNARVLQEANDPTVTLKDRIRFLGIFSNNLDEFFRVRVATLKRMVELIDKKKSLNIDILESPNLILDEIQKVVLKQQSEFNRIWNNINKELIKRKVVIINEKKLNLSQKIFVRNYFDDVVRPYIIPLMIENLPELPYLRDKSLYLAIVMRNKQNAYHEKFALIEIPSKSIGRFVILPSSKGTNAIILLEDIIKFNLPIIFSHFKFNHFDAHVFKITKDAEIDLDQEVGLNFVEKISKGVKNRRKGKPVRFVYDKEMNAELLDFLIQKLHLTRKSSIIPGGHIHNFRHFMDFPDVLVEKQERPKPFAHPAFRNKTQVSEVILKKDVMLHFPYHNYDPVIDMLREAAMDDDVISIKITAYRLASNSKVINALINAARNGKEVTVFLELKARFDEEANLEWKTMMEEEGVKVLVGIPNVKVHAKICIIQKRVQNKLVQYGFISTGNLNEKTARVYADHCLLTANKPLLMEVNKVFTYLTNWQLGDKPIEKSKHLLISPISMRNSIIHLINEEIKFAKQGYASQITVKLNSLSDHILLDHLQKAIKAGVKVNLIIRGILTLKEGMEKSKNPINAISIVDQYLEHARVMIFHNKGKQKVYISSADWMVRNLDHRIEVAVPVLDLKIKKELIDIINIQLKDNQKARILDTDLNNNYVPSLRTRKVKSQVETHHYLIGKK
ncbi:MAG: polyphosphate kinase 1 [Sediminibacterium sp.]|nr:MAG: polyphosphate kinase 1 [Sediminibacterium sp.]